MAAKVIIIFIVATIIAFSDAARWFEPLTINPDYPDQCFSQKYQKAFELGKDHDIPGECQKVRCDSQIEIVGITCSPFGLRYGCRIVEVDFTKPYPECCPYEVCDDDE